MKRDPRVDAYIARSGAFAQPILNHLRGLMAEVIPEGEETIKWSMPHFLYQGKNVAGMAAFKAHASFTIHGDSAFRGLAKDGAMGQFGKLVARGDLPDDAELKRRIAAAKGRIDAEGTALKKRPAGPRIAKPELPIPPAFATALDAAPAARATLEGFAPSHRREYVEWISEAKTEATRDKRIAQAIEWLAEGKRRNWKYERC